MISPELQGKLFPSPLNHFISKETKHCHSRLHPRERLQFLLKPSGSVFVDAQVEILEAVHGLEQALPPDPALRAVADGHSPKHVLAVDGSAVPYPSPPRVLRPSPQIFDKQLD